MQPAAQLADSPSGSWRVSRDGKPVAAVDLRSERGEVVVATGVNGLDPYRFATLEEADGFVGDLMTTFAFLGCDVARD
jgi:hypothetical protein